MITIREIAKSFQNPKCGSSSLIIDQLNLDLPELSCSILFGPNGCGKSTLLQIVSGLEKADSGIIKDSNNLRSNVGFVFQDYRRSLLPWLNAEENILYPLKMRGASRVEQQSALEYALARAQPDFDLRSRVYSLSGGQAQLIALLRALAIRPSLLILDEPFSAIDYERTLELRQILRSIAEERSLSIIMVSHDLDEAIFLADQLVLLKRRPTSVAKIIKLSFSEPRKIEVMGSTEYAAAKLNALEAFRLGL